jgi:hypothetical protein
MLNLLLNGLLGCDISRHLATEGDTPQLPVTRRNPPLNSPRRDTNCRSDLNNAIPGFDEQPLSPEAITIGRHT